MAQRAPLPAQRRRRIAFIGLITTLLLGTGMLVWRLSREDPQEITLAELNSAIEARRVDKLTIFEKSHSVTGEDVEGKKFVTQVPSEFTDELAASALAAQIDVAADGESEPWYQTLIVDLLPTLLIVGVFIYFAMMMQGGGRAGKFGQSRARRQREHGDGLACL